MNPKKTARKYQLRFFTRILFAALTVSLPGCNEDECQSHTDCEDLEGCVQGKCVPTSPSLGAENPAGGGGGNTIRMNSSTPTDSDSTDTDPLAPTETATDTSQTTLDTAYGAVPETEFTESSYVFPVGCVNYQGNYYSCTLTDYLTTNMCDLINENGCSPILFPEACKILLASAAGISVFTTCYSPLENNSGDAAEFECIEFGGEWMPCPYQE